MQNRVSDLLRLITTTVVNVSVSYSCCRPRSVNLLGAIQVCQRICAIGRSRCAVERRSLAALSTDGAIHSCADDHVVLHDISEAEHSSFDMNCVHVALPFNDSANERSSNSAARSTDSANTLIARNKFITSLIDKACVVQM